MTAKKLRYYATGILSLAAAYGTVGVGGAMVLGRGQLRGGRPRLAPYGDYARRSGWVLIGVAARTVGRQKADRIALRSPNRLIDWASAMTKP